MRRTRNVPGVGFSVERDLTPTASSSFATRTTRQVSAIRDRALDQPWNSFGEQLHAVIEAYSPEGKVDYRLAASSGMNQAVPSEGGFLVAPQFSQMIWDGLRNDGNTLLAQSDNYTVNGESLTLQANAETSRATGFRFGGVRGFWIAEAEQITKSTPKLRTVKLEPQQMAVLVYCTDKSLRNSRGALEQFVSKSAHSEINFMIGDGIINGTGAGQPRGMLGSPALITIAKQTSQANATILRENISKMWARLPANRQRNAVWYYNPEVEPLLDELGIAVKNVAQTENVGGFAAPTAFYDREQKTLKGRPLQPLEFLPALGTPGDLLLADMSAYATGTRAGLQTDVSLHVRFEFAETAFRFMFEIDGQSWLASPITPFKGTTLQSTMIVIAQR